MHIGTHTTLEAKERVQSIVRDRKRGNRCLIRNLCFSEEQNVRTKRFKMLLDRNKIREQTSNVAEVYKERGGRGI